MEKVDLKEGNRLTSKIAIIKDKINKIQVSIDRTKHELKDGKLLAYIPLDPGKVGIDFSITKEKLLMLLWQSKNELKIKLAFEERKLKEL